MESDLNVKLDGTNTSRINERDLSLGGDLKHRRSRKKRSERFRRFTSNLSQGCVIVIAVLPITGLFLGIGAEINNLSKNVGAQVFGRYLSNIGNVIFGNMPLLFAVGLSIAFTNQAPIAAFSAIIGKLVFDGLQSALILPVYNEAQLAEHDNTQVYNLLYYRHLDASVFDTNAGIFSLSSGVFGGMITAVVVVFLYNRFHEIKLPAVLNFFGGTRFVPIAVAFAMMPVSVLMCMIWPVLGLGLSKMGHGMGTLSSVSNFNAFIFGYLERALVPFGVHHAFYVPLWYSNLGGDMADKATLNSLAFIKVNGTGEAYRVIDVISGGKSVALAHAGQQQTWDQVLHALIDGQGSAFTKKLQGDYNMFITTWSISGNYLVLDGYTGGVGDHHNQYMITLKTFADATLTHPAAYVEKAGKFVKAFPDINPGQYAQGKFAFMQFGLPAAALAMVMAAPKENRKFASSMVVTAGLTSFITGITEPIEFTFLFLSPVLFWGVHAFLCALSFWLTGLFGMNVSSSFGSIIEFISNGVIPDALGYKTNCWIAILIGLAYAPLYFFLFYWWIKHFDLKTPGRGATKLYTKKDYLAKKDQEKDVASASFTKSDVQAYHVLNAIGGLDNLENSNACITKLRLSVKNDDLVDKNIDNLLREIGAQGVQRQQGYIMAVFGFDADFISTSIRKITKQVIDFNQLKDYVEKMEGNQVVAEKPSTPACEPSTSLEKLVIKSPLKGKVVDLSETEDIAFSGKTIGDGVAIVPEGGQVVSPIDGSVKVAFPGGHAYVVSQNGIDVLIHLGIDTVNINAKREPGAALLAFTPKVKVNDQVKVGQEIALVDLTYLKEHNYKSVTPIIATNESTKNYKLKVLVDLNSSVDVGTPIFELVKEVANQQ